MEAPVTPEEKLKDSLHAMYHTLWVNSLNAAAVLDMPELEKRYRFDAKGWPYWVAPPMIPASWRRRP